MDDNKKTFEELDYIVMMEMGTADGCRKGCEERYPGKLSAVLYSNNGNPFPEIPILADGASVYFAKDLCTCIIDSPHVPCTEKGVCQVTFDGVSYYLNEANNILPIARGMTTCADKVEINHGDPVPWNHVASYKEVNNSAKSGGGIHFFNYKDCTNNGIIGNWNNNPNGPCWFTGQEGTNQRMFYNNNEDPSFTPAIFSCEKGQYGLICNVFNSDDHGGSFQTGCATPNETTIFKTEGKCSPP